MSVCARASIHTNMPVCVCSTYDTQELILSISHSHIKKHDHDLIFHIGKLRHRDGFLVTSNLTLEPEEGHSD